MSRTRRQLLAATAAAGAAVYLGRSRSQATPEDAPNLLVVIVDTLRVDHAFDGRARTPAIDALAREGLRFTRFFPEAMPTVPARNSILSGQRQFPFSDWHDYQGLLNKPGWEPLDNLDTAFTTVLSRAGWWTGMVTDNPFLGFAAPYDSLRRSFDLFVRHGGQLGGKEGPVAQDMIDKWVHPAVRRAGGAERVIRYIANADYSEDERQSFAARVFGSATDALEVAARRRPFALVVDAYQPHEPWTPPRKYIDLYGDPDYVGPEPSMPRYGRVDGWLTDEEAATLVPRMRALYAAQVTMTDHWLGTLLQRLHELRLENETAIVLVSDHGVQLGEHGWLGKISVALHPELIQTPLILVHPDRRGAGRRSTWRASTHDIAPTLLSIAGVPAPPDSDGADLVPLLEGRRLAERAHSYGGYSDNHFARSDRWAYMADNRRARSRLFDLRADPDEARDVASLRPDVVDELYELVRARAGGDLPSYQ